MRTTRSAFVFLLSFLIVNVATLHSLHADSLTKNIENPQHGGILKIILPSGIRSLGSPSEAGMGTLYNIIAAPQLEALVKHDKQFRIQPRLAEKVDISSDGKTITFHLRKGITFQDGTPFNAAAVEYDIKNYTTNQVQPSYIKSISSYDILDEHTIRLNLSEFNLNLLFNLVWGPGFAVSAKAMQRETTPEKMAYDHMVGTGAFKLVEYERDVKAIFKKDDDYWQPGKPYLDGIEFHQISDPVTAVMALKAGEGHMLYNITPEQGAELKEAGFNIVPENLNPIGYITPDGGNADSPFSNKKVREALEYAIDKHALAKGIGLGYYTALSQFATENDAHYTSGLSARNYDAEKAKKLLADAGYPNGFNTEILALTTENRDILLSLQAYLGAVGIKAKLNIMDRGLLFKTMHEGWNNGILVNPFPCNTGLPVKIEMFFSSDMKAGRLVMGSVYKPEGWQEALMKAVNEPDDEKRIEYTKTVCKIMHDEAMAIPLWTAPQITAISPKVHDIQWAEGHGYFWEPQNTWLSK